MSIIFVGRVQGVGFRATVADIARRLNIDGWVANASDGSVHLVAQGDTESLIELKRAVYDRFSRNIVSDTESWSSAESRLEGFEIASDIVRPD